MASNGDVARFAFTKSMFSGFELIRADQANLELHAKTQRRYIVTVQGAQKVFSFTFLAIESIVLTNTISSSRLLDLIRTWARSETRLT